MAAIRSALTPASSKASVTCEPTEAIRASGSCSTHPGLRIGGGDLGLALAHRLQLRVVDDRPRARGSLVDDQQMVACHESSPRDPLADRSRIIASNRGKPWTRRRSIPFIGFLLAFLGLGVAYFAIYLGIRQERLKRELEHKERMRALELGRSLPGDIPWLSPTQRIGFLMAVGRAGRRVRVRLAVRPRPPAFSRTSGRLPGSSALFAIVCGGGRRLPRRRRGRARTQESAAPGREVAGRGRRLRRRLGAGMTSR